MSLVVVGLNHQSAPVELRERLAIPPEELKSNLLHLHQGASLPEAMLLSTCNRVEIYAVRPPDLQPEGILRALADIRGVHREGLLRHAFVREEETHAVRHIFRVAASLESMVVGEPQILGQIKEAFFSARDCGTVGTVLDRCLTMAFRGAKRVRSETEIGQGGVSISSVAVDLARSIFGDLPGSRVLLVGAGKMARHAALHFRASGTSDIVVVNRSIERGRALAEDIDARYAQWDQLDSELALADIVVASTGAPQTVIGVDRMKQVMRARRGKPVFLVDIAVPRDIDDGVSKLDSVFLYNVDDLQGILQSNHRLRDDSATVAGRMVDDEVRAFLRWRRSREVAPVIQALHKQARGIMSREVERALARLPALDEEQRKVIEGLGHSITQKLMHRPINTLRQSAEKDSGESRELASVLETVFELTEDFESEEAATRKHETSSSTESPRNQNSGAHIGDEG